MDRFYEGVDRLLDKINQLDMVKVIRSHIDRLIDVFNQISNKLVYLLLTSYALILHLYPSIDQFSKSLI